MSRVPVPCLLLPLLLLACGDKSSDDTAGAADDDCVRYYTALKACADEAGVADSTDAAAECADNEEDLDWACMADFVEAGDCSDQSSYATTVNGVWAACPAR